MAEAPAGRASRRDAVGGARRVSAQQAVAGAARSLQASHHHLVQRVALLVALATPRTHFKGEAFELRRTSWWNLPIVAPELHESQQEQ